jgi:serine/threonine protein kinase
MADGGFNCRSNRSGARHSSLHTTLSVLEGIYEYERNGYSYRLGDLKGAQQSSVEFLLEHKLYQSSTTAEVIDKRMLSLSYPSRWRYDILRALEYLHSAGVAYDARMLDALNILIGKRRSDGTWPQQAKHSGQTHLDMETAGGPGRWNTLRALKVLKQYKRDAI